MPIKAFWDREPEGCEKKANDFLQGKFIVGICSTSLPSFDSQKKKQNMDARYCVLFVAYK